MRSGFSELAWKRSCVTLQNVLVHMELPRRFLQHAPSWKRSFVTDSPSSLTNLFTVSKNIEPFGFEKLPVKIALWYNWCNKKKQAERSVLLVLNNFRPCKVFLSGGQVQEKCMNLSFSAYNCVVWDSSEVGFRKSFKVSKKFYMYNFWQCLVSNFPVTLMEN